MLKLNQRGFGELGNIMLLIVIVGAIGMAGVKVYDNQKDEPQQSSTSQSSQSSQADCGSRPALTTPVDVSKATGILYPGQFRGGNYKAHGGFRFDGSEPADITVKAPLDGKVERASRYNEQGEVQILIEFTANCGLSYRFDHILTVAPKFQAMVDGLPQPTEDSRTEQIKDPPEVKAGDTIATAVGFAKAKNVFVDFGLYDMNHKQASVQDTSQPTNSYGVCWLDWLNEADQAKVKALPAGDAQAGKTSDYCQ